MPVIINYGLKSPSRSRDRSRKLGITDSPTPSGKFWNYRLLFGGGGQKEKNGGKEEDIKDDIVSEDTWKDEEVGSGMRVVEVMADNTASDDPLDDVEAEDALEELDSWECSDQEDGDFEAFSGEEDVEFDGEGNDHEDDKSDGHLSGDEDVSEGRFRAVPTFTEDSRTDSDIDGLDRIFSDGGLLDEIERSDDSGKLSFLRAKNFLGRDRFLAKRSSSERDLAGSNSTQANGQGKSSSKKSNGRHSHQVVAPSAVPESPVPNNGESADAATPGVPRCLGDRSISDPVAGGDANPSELAADGRSRHLSAAAATGESTMVASACPNSPSTTPTTPTASSAGNRISRIFSLRRSASSTDYFHSHHGDKDGSASSAMRPLPEEEEVGLCGGVGDGRAQAPCMPPPSLPSPPLLLNPEQTKRRHILNSLIQSENNYLDSLQRLLEDYKKPLEESNPPILSPSKVGTIFYRVPQILNCHSEFRIALSEAVRRWDQDERIGDVFVASFSKAVVLEVYSDFINNFTEAMEVSKTESKRKSAFADFLKVKQITAHDRLNFYGLIVKPIQRFPQFILLLQDLLKETPPGHADRMALQLALTTLESLAEMLNERKRESEQIAAFRAKMHQIGGKLGKSEGGRVLLREDDVQRLDFDSHGHVIRTKSRRLLLLNDRVVCVAASGRPSEVEMTSSMGNSEKLSLKWSADIEEMEVIDGAGSGTLARLTTHVAGSTIKKTSLGKTNSNNVDKVMAENLAEDMSDLMHDFDVVSRINSLITTLKHDYPGLNAESLSNIMDGIQQSIRQKDDEMSWLDKTCLQLVIKRRDKTETLTFQMRSPAVKQDWVVDFRLARLALDKNNAPGWDILEHGKCAGRLPLYVKHLPVLHMERNTEVLCGTSYTLLVPTPTRTLRPVTYVWANATDGLSSYLKVFCVQVNEQISLKELATHTLSSCIARCMVYVPGLRGGVVTSGFQAGSAHANWELPLTLDLVWVATDDRRVILYGASDPEKGREISRIVLPSDPCSLLYHAGQVWVGLFNGVLRVFRRDSRNVWDLESPYQLHLGEESVSALLPVSGGLYASCGRKVLLIDPNSLNPLRQFNANLDETTTFKGSVMNLRSPSVPGTVSHMAVAGVGLWVAMANSSTIALYHTESFIHLQDINVANNVSRVLAARDVNSKGRAIYVTALSAAKGLLWVGTNVGIALTIPLPRLEGVPIISGKANISYHAHFGQVRMFLAVNPKVSKLDSSTSGSQVNSSHSHRSKHQTIPEEDPTSLTTSMTSASSGYASLAGGDHRPVLEKQISDSFMTTRSAAGFVKQFSSPLLGGKRGAHRDSAISLSRKSSKTLPRGFTMGPGSESSGENVYGLYGELMNVASYESCDNSHHNSKHTDIHRSDPELDTLQYRVSTLDRRVTMKSQRPRSLDLSSWSVGSRGSNHTSSSGEEPTPATGVAASSVITGGAASTTATTIANNSNSGGGGGGGTLVPGVAGISGSQKTSPSVSRTASFASDKSTANSDSSSWSNSVTGSMTERTLTREKPEEPTKLSNKEKAESLQRTVTTLMGGRGYIQWRASHIERSQANQLTEINNSDAYLVIWDHKI